MIKKIFSIFVLILLLLGGMVLPLNAVTIQTCEIEVVEIKWWNIITPGRFLPLIPEECSQTSEGKIAMLNPGLIPEILFRLYGFLVSLMFALILPVFTFAGVQWSWEVFNAGQAEAAKTLLKQASAGLVSVSVFYLAVMLILQFFGADTILTNTDLNSFFNF